MINAILDYQKIDLDIIKKEKELNANENKRTANNMKSFVKDAQDKIINLDSQSGAIIEEYNTIIENFNKAEKQLDLITQNMSKLSDEEKQKYITQLDNIVKVLDGYERKINEYQQKVNDILRVFFTTRKKVDGAKQKYKEATENFSVLEKETSLVINAEKEKLKELEKTIKPQLLEMYKQIKSNKILPVIVKNENGKCGGCKVVINKSSLETLKNNKIIICENCGRIIY